MPKYPTEPLYELELEAPLAPLACCAWLNALPASPQSSAVIEMFRTIKNALGIIGRIFSSSPTCVVTDPSLMLFFRWPTRYQPAMLKRSPNSHGRTTVARKNSAVTVALLDRS